MGSPTSLPRLPVFPVPSVFFKATQNGKSSRNPLRTPNKGKPCSSPGCPRLTLQQLGPLADGISRRLLLGAGGGVGPENTPWDPCSRRHKDREVTGGFAPCSAHCPADLPPTTELLCSAAGPSSLRSGGTEWGGSAVPLSPALTPRGSTAAPRAGRLHPTAGTAPQGRPFPSRENGNAPGHPQHPSLSLRGGS